MTGPNQAGPGADAWPPAPGAGPAAGHGLFTDTAQPVEGVVVGTATDVGRLRSVNEDGYLAVSPAFVVVDGMGGHAAGRAATQAALGALCGLAGAVVTAVEEVLEAVAAAQQAIVAIPSHAAFLPGATVAGAVLAALADGPWPAGDGAGEGGASGRLTWVAFNIGDARVYLLRDGVLTQVTRDHSQVQDLIDSGRLSPVDARNDPRRNIVTRALGGGIADSAVPDVYAVPAQAGDRILVCSDGLSDELDDEALAVVLTAGYGAQQTADLLVAASLEEGGHDNTTAVVVDAVGAGAASGSGGRAGQVAQEAR